MLLRPVIFFGRFLSHVSTCDCLLFCSEGVLYITEKSTGSILKVKI